MTTTATIFSAQFAQLGYTLEMGNTPDGYPMAAAHKPGRAGKIKFLFKYRFANQQQRLTTLETYLTRLQQEREMDLLKALKIAEAKKAGNHPYQLGTIIYSSWGYEQTNVDFYQVTKVSGYRIELKAIGKITRETGFMCGHTEPAPNLFATNNKGEEPAIVKHVKISYYNNSVHYHLPHAFKSYHIYTPGHKIFCSWYA